MDIIWLTVEDGLLSLRTVITLKGEDYSYHTGYTVTYFSEIDGESLGYLLGNDNKWEYIDREKHTCVPLELYLNKGLTS